MTPQHHQNPNPAPEPDGLDGDFTSALVEIGEARARFRRAIPVVAAWPRSTELGESTSWSLATGGTATATRHVPAVESLGLDLDGVDAANVTAEVSFTPDTITTDGVGDEDRSRRPVESFLAGPNLSVSVTGRPEIALMARVRKVTSGLGAVFGRAATAELSHSLDVVELNLRAVEAARSDAERAAREGTVALRAMAPLLETAVLMAERAREQTHRLSRTSWWRDVHVVRNAELEETIAGALSELKGTPSKAAIARARKALQDELDRYADLSDLDEAPF